MLYAIAHLLSEFPAGLHAVASLNGIKRNFPLFWSKKPKLNAENYAPANHQANELLFASPPFGRDVALWLALPFGQRRITGIPTLVKIIFAYFKMTLSSPPTGGFYWAKITQSFIVPKPNQPRT